MGGGRANGAPPRRVSADRAARPSSNPHSHRTLPRVCLGGWSGALGGCGCVRARAVPCVRGRSQQEKTTRARASERAGALAAPPPASIFLFRSRALQARRVNTTHGRRRAPPVPVGRDPAPPHHRGGGHGGPVAARAAGERRRAGSRCIGFFFFDVERLFSSFSFVLFLVLFLALPLSYRIISMCFSKRSAADRERKPKVWSRGQKERKAKEATHAIDGRRCRRLLLFSSSSLFTITILYSLPGNIQCHRLEKTTPISRKPGVSRSSERASERARERERERERERKINKGRSQQRSSPKEAEKKKWALEGTLFATEKQNQSTDIDLSCIAFFRR